MRKKKAIIHESSTQDSMVNEPLTAGYYSTGGLHPGFLFSGNTPVAPRAIDERLGLVKKGVPRKAVDELIEATGLSLSEIALSMHLTERTLRNYSPTTLLGTEASERLLEIALLYEKGKEVFGSLEAFKQYMRVQVPALGYKQPIDFLDTSMGIAYLNDIIGRIEHGVFS